MFGAGLPFLILNVSRAQLPARMTEHSGAAVASPEQQGESRAGAERSFLSSPEPLRSSPLITPATELGSQQSRIKSHGVMPVRLFAFQPGPPSLISRKRSCRARCEPWNESWGWGLIPYSKAPKAMFFKSQKRAERRMKRDFPARVMLGGFAKRDCKVVDISESGARIVVSSAIELPRQFSIAFASTTRPCQLVWRNGTMAGVKFLK